MNQKLLLALLIALHACASSTSDTASNLTALESSQANREPAAGGAKPGGGGPTPDLTNVPGGPACGQALLSGLQSMTATTTRQFALSHFADSGSIGRSYRRGYASSQAAKAGQPQGSDIGGGGLYLAYNPASTLKRYGGANPGLMQIMIRPGVKVLNVHADASSPRVSGCPKLSGLTRSHFWQACYKDYTSLCRGFLANQNIGLIHYKFIRGSTLKIGEKPNAFILANPDAIDDSQSFVMTTAELTTPAGQSKLSTEKAAVVEYQRANLRSGTAFIPSSQNVNGYIADYAENFSFSQLAR